MKKYITLLIVAVVIASCSTQYDKAMKSADKDFILKVANEQFAKKKWSKSVALYERVTNLVSGTDEMANVIYNSAYANYYDKQYKLAGHQFKNFAVNFPNDARAEEASYMSALCYYEGSLDYNLDQSSTELAINELQSFINKYPDSERSKNINELIDELSYKLEYKAYENAKQYYKMGDYKAANVTFDNVLQDFPATKLRPNIYAYMMESRYELAMNSVYDLKQERLENAVAFSKQIEKELPNSEQAKKAINLREKLMREQQNFAELQKEIEAKKLALNEKQKLTEAKLSEQNKTEDQLKEQVKAENNAMEALRDSAKIATPPPAATFKIQR